jgi:hypothetical protein
MLGNHSEIFELTKATTISLKTEEQNQYWMETINEQLKTNFYQQSRNSKNH